MRLPHPFYLSCLLSLVFSGGVHAATPSTPVLPVTQAADKEPRTFRIPAADAHEALDQFLLQAGTAVVFVIEHVRGVRTNSVKGRYEPREALERLVANTVLVVMEDTRSGTLMIKRKSSLKEGGSSGANHVPPPKKNLSPARTPSAPTSSMKKNPLTILAAWLALIVAPAHSSIAAEGSSTAASTQQAGTIFGQVSNTATEAFLEGATVRLSGTDRIALTDREGRYELSHVPSEAATLEVSYTGLTTKRVPVAPTGGQKVVVNVGLGSDVYIMDKFTVAGIREGQAMAITQQRNAPNVKNVAATDAFGGVADGNPAEALRLLPGVSAINDENESRFVMVRGIDANLNSMTIDGMKLSTGGTTNNRQTDMSQIPLGSVEIMEVTKSPTPDMDGDSVGGNINLRSASIFDRPNPRRITFSASAGIRTFGDSAPPTAYTTNRVRGTFAFGYADVFGEKKNIGIAINLSESLNWTPSAGLLLNTYETTATYPAYLRTFTHYDYHSVERTRIGANIKIDYKLSEQSRFFLNSTYTGYRSKQMFSGGGSSVTGIAQVATLDASGQPIPFQVQFPFGNPSYRAGGFNAAGARVQASILPGYTDYVTEMGNATYGTTASLDDSESKRYSFQPGANHRFGQLEIDYSGTYQTNPAWRGGKEGRKDYIRGYNLQVTNTSWRLDGTSTDDRARRALTQTGGPDVTNPLNWAVSGLATTVTEQTTDLYGAQLNLKRYFQSPVRSYIKTGAKFMSEERTTTNPSVVYTYTGPKDLLASLIDTSIQGNLPAGEFHPFGRIPTYLSTDKITQLHDDRPDYFTSNAATSLQTALQNDKTAKEEIVAAYFMGNVDLGRLSVLGGMRVETTYVSGESAVQDPRAGLTLTDPVERVRAQWGKRAAVKRDYRNVLPGLHFKYAATKDLLVRASYSTSFGRPSFGSVYPDTRINYDNERITQNNPGLLPQTADNFDVSIEHYFEPVGVVSIGVFLKEIKNFLYSSVLRIPTGTGNGFDGEYANWELFTQDNGGFGRVRGLELNYSQQLSFLPGFWRGFGVFANFTYLDTMGNYGRITAAPSGALVNFIPRVINAGLSYSAAKFTARINVNHTGDYLRAYNANPLLASYRKEKTMADLKLVYRYSRELGLFFDVANIFNAKDRYYVGTTPLNFTAVRNFGARFQAGVNGNF